MPGLNQVDEIRKKLAEAGLNPDGQWTHTDARTARAPLLERQKKLLENLEQLLVMQIEQDTSQVADLHAKMQQLKHGGGR